MKNIIKIGLIAFVIIKILFFIQMWQNNRILKNNVEALMNKSIYNDSLRTLQTQELILSSGQIKQYFPEIDSTLKELDIKIRKLERYSSVNSNSIYQLKNKVNDTVYIKDIIVNEKLIRDTVPVQYINYQDKWIDFKQCIIADSAYTHIRTKDSLSIFYHWERPGKFWFIRYGRKRYYQTVKNYNPYSTISHSLNIKKR